MGHRRRVFDERFDAAEGFREGEELRRGHEGFRLLEVVGGQFEGDHAAEVVHLAGGDVVTGVVAEAGPVHLAHVGPLPQPVRDAASVGAVALDPQVQRFDAAQDEEAVERLGDGAAVVLDGPEFGVNRSVFRDECAHDDVAVSAEVLRDAVHDDVCAEFERSLEHRRGERVVDGEADAARTRDSRNGRDVRDLHHRIRRRLEPNQLRLLRDRGLDIRGILGVDERELDAEGRPIRAKEPAGAAVEVLAGDDVVARLQGLEHDIDRCKAGGKGETMRPALQFCKRSFQSSPRRVVAPRIFPAFVNPDSLLNVR